MADIKQLAPLTFKWEGGYQADPSDKGNYNSRGELVGTKYGVSAKAYEAFYKKVPTAETMKNLMPEQGSFVLLSFWNHCHADFIVNQSIANLFVDWYYNAGAKAIKEVQRLVKVTQDGSVGSQTIDAINKADQKLLFSQIWAARERYYRTVAMKPDLAKYLKGWLNRLNDFKYSAK